MVSTEISQTEWDNFVNRHPDASGYHLWRWREIFQSVFKHECVYLAAWESGQVAGVLPLVCFRSWLFGRFGVSLPFVNYGGVLATSDEARRDLLIAAAEVGHARRFKHIEFRHRERQYLTLPAKQHKVAMLLALSGSSEELWSRFDRKVRNQVRKAEKSNLQVEIGGAELVEEFYRVFAHNMRDLGTPVYSRAFFDAVLREFADRARVFVVRREGQPIGGAITYTFRETIEVPWASSLREYLSLCPNNLLYWSIIQYAVGQGSTMLDFGRSTPDEGTFQFKRQWGAEPRELFWEYSLRPGSVVPDQSPKNPKFRLAIEGWKRLPVRLSTLLGPPIVRGIP
jgi:serine/alanine adding enzyme